MHRNLIGRRAIVAVGVAGTLLLAACGDDAPEPLAATAEDTTPATDAIPATDKPVEGPLETPDEIIAAAGRAAENLGEPDPMAIEWVSTTRAAANSAISGSTVGAGTEDVDVLVIQAQGDFTVNGQGGPPDEEGNAAPPPTGKALTLVIDSRSGQTLDIGVQPEPTDLTQLGAVEQPS